MLLIRQMPPERASHLLCDEMRKQAHTDEEKGPRLQLDDGGAGTLPWDFSLPVPRSSALS